MLLKGSPRASVCVTGNSISALIEVLEETRVLNSMTPVPIPAGAIEVIKPPFKIKILGLRSPTAGCALNWLFVNETFRGRSRL
jgi:hypothetical protein